MINTLTVKMAQLKNGFLEFGSGPKKLFIMGSCRVAPYLNYLEVINSELGNPYTIYSIDPFNWCFNLNDERVNMEEEINKMEQHDGLLKMLSSVDIFVHEYYANFGMFNVDSKKEKNIYQFGMNPEHDVCIPNLNDIFILFGDIVAFDMDIRQKAVADYNVLGRLSLQLQEEIYLMSNRNIQKFLSICEKSDLPEMSQIFTENYLHKRFYWTHNHVTKHFTLAIFELLNEKYFKLDISKELWGKISEYDMFDSHYTKLTDYDVKWHEYKWPESVVPLRVI